MQRVIQQLESEVSLGSTSLAHQYMRSREQTGSRSKGMEMGRIRGRVRDQGVEMSRIRGGVMDQGA